MLSFTQCPSPLLGRRNGSFCASPQGRISSHIYRRTSFVPATVGQKGGVPSPCAVRAPVRCPPVAQDSSSLPAEQDVPAPFDLESMMDTLVKKVTMMPPDTPDAPDTSAEVAAKLAAVQRAQGLPYEGAPAADDDLSDDERIVQALMTESHLTREQPLASAIADAVAVPAVYDANANADGGDGADNSRGDADDATQRVAASRMHQANPRMPDVARLRSAQDAIRRRRAQLAAERGEDELVASADAPSPLQQEVLAASARTLTITSVRDAQPFAPKAPAPRSNALVAAASLHAAMNARAPAAYRPFLALSEAFHNAEHMSCPRCGEQAPVDSFKENAGVCQRCYGQIYLYSAPGDTSSGEGVTFMPRKEMQAVEKRLAVQAGAYVRNLVKAAESASGASAQSKSARAIPTPNSRPADLSGATGEGGDGNGSAESSDLADGWQVAASDRSMRTINPIRNLVQNIRVKPNPSKDVIKLSVGDPTVYGNLVVSDSVIAKFVENLEKRLPNGYSHSMGSIDARSAVAKCYSTSQSPLTADDVILTGGTSGALELVLGALANEGDNILLPRPGFPLFRTLAEGFGIECRFYQLSPEREWQAELADFSKLVDSRTRAIVVNNPSNPCGSVFGRDHIEDIVAVASSLRVPIVADEVYADMVFPPATFTSFGVASTDVPVLVVGGVSKQFVVPGWRLGWVLVHDRGDVFERAGVRKGLRQLTTRMLVPNTPAQMVLPTMLEDAAGFEAVMAELRENAAFAMQRLQKVPGLKCIRPRGAMYMMVQVDVQKLGLKGDMDFVENLLHEESVFALPGQCFQAPNFIRVVFAAPKKVLGEAFSRMDAFCRRRIEQSRS